jgi:hypothetical protein
MADIKLMPRFEAYRCSRGMSTTTDSTYETDGHRGADQRQEDPKQPIDTPKACATGWLRFNTVI